MASIIRKLAVVSVSLLVFGSSGHSRLGADTPGDGNPRDVTLATLCIGSPETAVWKDAFDSEGDSPIGLDGSNSCYLYWTPDSTTLKPFSNADGYVQMNLLGIWCGDDPPEWERNALESPRFLYVKVPRAMAEDAPRDISVEVRVMTGTAFATSAEQTVDAKWGSWVGIQRHRVGSDTVVLSIPFEKLGVGGAYWFQVRTRVTEGSKPPVENTVDFLSFINC
jgi:hypothetical protein